MKDKIKKFNELRSYDDQNISDQELYEMANIGKKFTGIDNVVIWIGPNPGYHWMRIKVSNVPNKSGFNDCFTLTIPNFEIIGEVNKSLITPEVLGKIKKWVILNMEIIKRFSTDDNVIVDDLTDQLKPIS